MSRMVYFITYSRTPDGDALAIRSANIASIFAQCGFDVMLVGMGEGECFQFQKNGDLSCMSLRIKGRDILTRLKNYFGFKARLKNVLEKAEDIDAIILNGLPINALLYVKKICRKRGIKLFVDCCEWYSPEQFKHGKLSIAYLLNDYYVRRYIDKHTYPIAISKYLESYFRQKQCSVVNIPAILDVEKTSHNKSPKSSKTILMYAGTAGRKDYLHVILKGLSLLVQEELTRIEFRIFGVSAEEIRANFKAEILDKVSGVIKCYGRVAREVVLENLEAADFTVLMRSETQRYAKAGFPTKVVESLASATPVICNLTSDLGDYIVDGQNGIVVDSENAEDFCQAVKKAIGLTVSEKEMMSKNARTTAEQNFDYRIYKDEIKTLIENI